MSGRFQSSDVSEKFKIAMNYHVISTQARLDQSRDLSSFKDTGKVEFWYDRIKHEHSQGA